MDDVINPDDFPLRKRVSRLPEKEEKTARDPYDALRFWSALTHGIGILFSIAGTVLLLLHASRVGATSRHYISFSVYGVSMGILYTASTLYHCIKTSVRGRLILRKFDHISIYLLIAGTYTPICLIPLRGVWGRSLLTVIWILAFTGIVFSLLKINAPRWVASGIYIFMGWLALIAFYPLAEQLSAGAFFLLLLGGILYTIGGILYALKWPGRSNPTFGCHEIFHIFVLLGSFFHYILMYQVIAYL